MYSLNWLLIALLFFGNSTGFFIGIDQNATCTMDDKEHKAHYHCPNGYEVVYTGEGEKECSGKCYQTGSKPSLRNAIVQLLIDRKMNPNNMDKEIKSAVDKLTVEEEITLRSSQGIVTIYAPKRKR